jgi:hypothetical protein
MSPMEYYWQECRRMMNYDGRKVTVHCGCATYPPFGNSAVLIGRQAFPRKIIFTLGARWVPAQMTNSNHLWRLRCIMLRRHIVW